MSASEDTRVGIKAAFPVKKRELNGLNRVAGYLNDNRAERIPVVGYVEFVKHTETVDGDEMTVALVVVEPVVNAQGRDVKGYAGDVKRMIEDMRKSAGKPPVADTLFDGKQTKDLDDELDGQIEGIDRDAKLAGDVAQVDATSGTGDSSKTVEAGRTVPEKIAEQTVDDKPATGGNLVKPGYLVGEGDQGVKPVGRKARGATVRPPAADPFRPDAA